MLNKQKLIPGLADEVTLNQFNYKADLEKIESVHIYVSHLAD